MRWAGRMGRRTWRRSRRTTRPPTPGQTCERFPARRRSDFGVAITDARLVAVGGTSAGTGPQERGRARSRRRRPGLHLPDLGTARHGVAVAGRRQDGVRDRRVDRRRRSARLTSSAEALKLAPRRPATRTREWRTLPDAPTATVDDGVDRARRRDLGRRRHARRRDAANGGELRPPDGTMADAASAADPAASRDGGDLSR